MIRLTYASQLAPATTDADIDDIVTRAAAFNRSQGITGLLAIEKNRVCQTLEGPQAEVDALYASIRRDARHSGVLLLDRREIDRPYFQSWGMTRGVMFSLVEMALS